MNKLVIILVLLATTGIASSQNQTGNRRIVTNPIELNYRFQFDEPSRREAADPVVEYYKGKYYLFASKSGGYWSSPDLAEWTYIRCTTLPVEDYAPTAMALGDTLYFMASGGNPRIYKTTDPDRDAWVQVDTKFKYGNTDPAFYKDDDGRVFLYWGCSDKDPIMGVQVDPADGFRALGEAQVLIEHHGDLYGWEVPGVNNEENRTGWNEGPCMIKYKGKYYLQYAAPGTQYRIYGDGLYVSDQPLGPFKYEENSPFSFKPGGFVGGAGHGHTFQDVYGNYWHIASMVISVRHMFERRLGLFPVYFSGDNTMYAHTAFSDYPFLVPDKKTDFQQNDCSVGWNLLSYGKAVKASSVLSGYEARNANDEKIETWWSSQSGKAGEWLQLDLGKRMEVYAVQINFADQDFRIKAPESYVNYQYYIEYSDDGKNWQKMIDKTDNTRDLPHELVVLPKSQKGRYFRIVNTKDMDGKFSLSGFRLFGQGGGKKPQAVSGFKVERDSKDKRIFRFTWDKQKDATGYILRWGVKKDALNNAAVVYDAIYEGRYFNRDSEYYFSIEAFNENGYIKK